ncbi:DcuS/MalK family sensor histidine kinase [Sporosalibacterium faouarense]|uniref:DcuS/MalK family sensor histidine kinase n=1 Tax=Sporosalibacterium faouarense TaxID=516123 RepID=UPI00192C638C|nr:DcuS/MalK family sensor histidine kinase [Sporosalibacterium faouarense]
MKKKGVSLQTKIIILIITVIFISLALVGAFVTQWAVNNVQNKVETNVMNVAQIVANSTGIRDALDNKDPNWSIRDQVDMMLNSINQIDFIVVTDMNGTRYSHPIHERIGKKFVGGDETRVVKEGETYISEAIGTLGKSVRAFVPIYNREEEQIGFVVVGTLAESVNEAKHQVILTIILSSFFGLFIGIVGAFLLAKNIKRSLLGFEPYQIAQLYLENKGMLEAIHEGIIAIDEDEKITLCNESAIKILKLEDDEIVGKKILDVFPNSRLVEVLNSGEAEYDREQQMNDTFIMTNRVPIKDNNNVVGAIATFRDKTMITRLAEEITGVKQMVDALRANTHEFLNKLHVILGLIHLKELEKAKKYIIDITGNQQQIMSTINSRIKDSTVAALLLGKISRAKELGVEMTIKDTTLLENKHGRIKSSALVTILGNLIENALEAASKSNKNKKRVSLNIAEEEKKIRIIVEDNGIGIDDKDLAIVSDKGFTTKPGSKGVGLFLVKEAVKSLDGNIEFQSKINEGTSVIVNLLKGDKND